MKKIDSLKNTLETLKKFKILLKMNPKEAEKLARDIETKINNSSSNLTSGDKTTQMNLETPNIILDNLGRKGAERIINDSSPFPSGVYRPNYNSFVKSPEENKDGVVYPPFIEDNHAYVGKSYFANIDQFSKQACQPFPNIKGKVRFSPVKQRILKNKDK